MGEEGEERRERRERVKVVGECGRLEYSPLFMGA